MNDLTELGDRLAGEFATLFLDPDLAGLRATAERMLELDPRIYGAAKAALIAHCKRNKIRLVTTGGAGGRIDTTRVQVDDLARTIQDALASSVRARLRKEYGFTRDPKKKFGVECVFSPEQLRRPVVAACDVAPAANTDAPQANGPQGLNCAGYGSSVAVTSTFGMAAAARVIDQLLKGAA